jgi:predicted signal transduction protein with EAL and GGDEF domain
MTVDEGVVWTQRLRDRLVHTLSTRTVPAFTASFGVVDSSAADTPEQLVRLADGALYRAKRDGRDRAAVADAPGTEAGEPLVRASDRKAAVDLRMLAEPH